MLYVSFSLIIIFIVCLISSSVVLWYNHKKPIFLVWSLLGYFVSFWAVGFYLTISASDAESALFWGRFHNLIAMMIAPLFVHFSYLVLSRKSKFIVFAYLSSAALLILSLIFADVFIPRVEPTDPFEYYIRGGYLHISFFALYVFLSSVGVANLVLALPKTEGLKKKQIIYILSAYAIGFAGGGTSFPMCYGVELYPFGVPGVIVYITLISYTIINHKFLELSVVMSKGITKVLTMFVLSVVYFLAWYFYDAYMVPNMNIVILFNITFLVIACESYQWLKDKIKKLPDNLIIKREYNLNFVSKELSSILINAVDPDQLINNLDEYFKGRLKLAEFSFYIDAKLTKVDDVGLVKYGDERKTSEHDAVENLRVSFVRKPRPLFFEEASIELRKSLKALNGKVCVPFVNEREVIGLLLVQPRKGDAHFSSDDYSLFNQMVEQLGSSLSRIQSHINITNAVRSLAGSIAHEMRNPLGQLRYSLDAIQNEIPLSDSNSAVIDKEVLEVVFENLAHGQNAVRRGLQIIDMTLDEVKGKIVDPDDFTYLSAAELTGRAVDEYCYENERERNMVSTEVHGDFYFKGDETMYQFIIFNLLKNALYYFKNDSAGRVSIEIRSDSKFNKVNISDNGPGIEPKKRAKLFESFYTSGKKEGTGLGLSYCKRVMQSFGGDVICESTVGKGTQFSLILPKISQKDFDQYKSSIIENIKVKIGGKHFLVVDDQEMNRMTVKSFFQLVDVSIDEAENGLEAINMLREGEYDGIIMDISMPVMDGLEAVERIRAGEAGEEVKDVPVIAFTSEKVYFASIKCDKVGCDGFIAKSTKMINFLEIASDVISGHKELKDIPDCLFENKRVLIADDDAMSRMMIRKLLEEMNIKVLEAHDGNKVLDIFKAIACDLVIMDIQMPGMDGLEAVRKLREMNKEVSVIALSGYSEDELVNQAKNAGMSDYLVKPVTKKVLYRKLRKYLSNSLTEYDIKLPGLSGYSDTEILDVEHLRSFESMGASFVEKFGRMFPENSSQLIENIEAAYEKQDITEFERVTHALKGSAANIGARRLYLFCTEANDDALKKIWPSSSGWLTELKDLNEQTVGALKAYVQKNTSR
ncbi:MAG: response regulator [Lentisphaeraceae bacterium]|nr:response regulator [Lentisphaeraceae bacterium]